jgi:hypothetical protein
VTKLSGDLGRAVDFRSARWLEEPSERSGAVADDPEVGATKLIGKVGLRRQGRRPCRARLPRPLEQALISAEAGSGPRCRSSTTSFDGRIARSGLVVFAIVVPAWP